MVPVNNSVHLSVFPVLKADLIKVTVFPFLILSLDLIPVSKPSGLTAIIVEIFSLAVPRNAPWDK